MIAAIFFAALAAVIVVLAFTWGHKAGRRSHHCDAPAAYAEGVTAEAARWEAVTGTTFREFQAWRTGLGPDPFANLAAAGERREEPPPTEVLMAEAARQGYTGEQPAVPSVAEVDELAARYRAAHRQPCPAGYPACECEGDPYYGHARAEPGPPIVADITSARPSVRVKLEDDVRPEVADAIRRAMNPDETPTIAGVVLTGYQRICPDCNDTSPHERGDCRSRTGPDWLEHQMAEMDRDAQAYMRALDADARSWRLQIAAGRQP